MLHGLLWSRANAEMNLQRYVESLEVRLEKMDKLLTKVSIHSIRRLDVNLVWPSSSSRVSI